ncbi:MAG: pilus assembly protein [Caulobacter sp.]|nr:pilus assembly protein [Caulobacter sp.]
MPKTRFHFADERGTAAIEFAMLAPALVAMLLGIVCYGGYFWLSHSVQQSANDGARAAIGGLNKAERASLAQASVTAGLPAYSILDPKAVKVVVVEDAQRMTVTVSYDASATPFWLFKGILPMPSSTIASNAVVRLGGY